MGRWRGVVATIAPLLVFSTISACSSSSPTAPGMTPTTTLATLAAGSYTLRLDPGTPPDALGNLCSGSGSAAVTASASWPVTVAQNNAMWFVQPIAAVDRGLVVTLQVVGSGFEGTAAGAAVDGLYVVTLGTTSPAAPVRLTGSSTTANTLTGFTAGAVQFSTTGATGGCQYYRWSLVPR
jgi:hypothetical protein